MVAFFSRRAHTKCDTKVMFSAFLSFCLQRWGGGGVVENLKMLRMSWEAQKCINF